MRGFRLLALAVWALCLLVAAPPAIAGHRTDPRTKNLHPMGHIEEPAVLGGFGGANPDIHTDIAFSGRYAFQGNWDGFNIRDISSPGNPKQVSRTFCDGNQGDLVVYGRILVRAWNTPAGTPGAFGAGLTCDGQAVPAGFEGVHVFDIGNLADPVLVAAVPLTCATTGVGGGSHTVTAVPDLENDRLLVYSSPASGAMGCSGFHVIEVPLDRPEDASLLRFESADHIHCHDIGVILGDAMMASCAGGVGFAVWSLRGPGGSLEDPELMYTVDVPTVTIGHSAAFSWDGKVLVFGHEPGGGVAAECEATDDEFKKSFFFYRAADGVLLGRWVLPRPQAATENCTLHNYNIVPVRGRNILVHGSYQSGTAVLDFTNPAAAVELAFSDPAPRPVPPGTPFCCDVGGAWSSYWYNGFIYESHINEGLNVFRFSGRQAAGALRLTHLNPQTQEFTLP